jgi:hypothetical protein
VPKRTPISPETAFIIPFCKLKLEGFISHKALNAQTEILEMYLDRCSENNRMLMYFVDKKGVKVEGCEGCKYFSRRK